MKAFAVFLAAAALVATANAGPPAAEESTTDWIDKVNVHINDALNAGLEKLAHIAAASEKKGAEVLEKIKELTRQFEAKKDQALAKLKESHSKDEKSAVERLAKELEEQINKMKDLKDQIEKLSSTNSAKMQ